MHYVSYDSEVRKDKGSLFPMGYFITKPNKLLLLKN